MSSGSGRNLATAREALLAELLQDVDALVSRLEQVDAALAAKMGQAASDAAGKSFLAARLSFESMISDQERKLSDAGRHAAAQIGTRISTGLSQLFDAHSILERRAYVAVLIAGCVSLIAGGVGGAVGALLIRSTA